MAAANNPSINRAQIAHLVRESLRRQMQNSASPKPAQHQGPNPLVVNISARHCHLSQESVEILFGKGHQLTPKKWLYQEGQYAAEESVTLIGPRSRVISNLRILGPCRDFDQVELAATDAISLGFKIPVRNSGNIAGTPGCMLMGPAGFRVRGDLGMTFARIFVRVHPSFKLEVHIDTDEGNACGFSQDVPCELIK